MEPKELRCYEIWSAARSGGLAKSAAMLRQKPCRRVVRQNLKACDVTMEAISRGRNTKQIFRRYYEVCSTVGLGQFFKCPPMSRFKGCRKVGGRLFSARDAATVKIKEEFKMKIMGIVIS